MEVKNSQDLHHFLFFFDKVVMFQLKFVCVWLHCAKKVLKGTFALVNGVFFKIRKTSVIDSNIDRILYEGVELLTHSYTEGKASGATGGSVCCSTEEPGIEPATFPLPDGQSTSWSTRRNIFCVLFVFSLIVYWWRMSLPDQRLLLFSCWLKYKGRMTVRSRLQENKNYREKRGRREATKSRKCVCASHVSAAQLRGIKLIIFCFHAGGLGWWHCVMRVRKCTVCLSVQQRTLLTHSNTG